MKIKQWKIGWVRIEAEDDTEAAIVERLKKYDCVKVMPWKKGTRGVAVLQGKFAHLCKPWVNTGKGGASSPPAKGGTGSAAAGPEAPEGPEDRARRVRGGVSGGERIGSASSRGTDPRGGGG